MADPRPRRSTATAAWISCSGSKAERRASSAEPEPRRACGSGTGSHDDPVQILGLSDDPVASAVRWAGVVVERVEVPPRRTRGHRPLTRRPELMSIPRTPFCRASSRDYVVVDIAAARRRKRLHESRTSRAIGERRSTSTGLRRWSGPMRLAGAI